MREGNKESEIRLIPEGWDYLSLDRVFRIERGGSPRPISEYLTESSDGYNWIKIGDTKKIEKYEALVRLKQDNEIISPFMFLEISKKTNLYPEISYVMLEKTLSFFCDKAFTCTLNIELENIKDKKFCSLLWEAIAKYNMQDRLTLELVESEGIEKFEEIKDFLASARSFGCKLAIDDFGTGYSNFNYLVQLNADYIKLDGSIIKEINNPTSGAKNIISAIVLFAQGQGMKTVAEFVSSKEIFDSVCEIGIDYSQGYFISEPKNTLKEI